jgi:hypothetical protein
VSSFLPNGRQEFFQTVKPVTRADSADLVHVRLTGL